MLVIEEPLFTPEPATVTQSEPDLTSKSSSRFERRKHMDWEAPSFVEVKMDAEINSYQDDFADIPDITEPSLEDQIMTAPP